MVLYLIFAVAVVPGRTRTLVERFERRERTNDVQTTILPSYVLESEKTREQTNSHEVQVVTPSQILETEKTREQTSNYEVEAVATPSHISETEKTRERTNNYEVQAVAIPSHISETEKARERTNNYEVRAMITPRTPETKRMTINCEAKTRNIYEAKTRNNYEAKTTLTPSRVPETDKTENLQVWLL